MEGSKKGKAKSNISKTWRDWLLHALPHYTGPYNVGYLEMELPAREPRSLSHIKRNHRWVQRPSPPRLLTTGLGKR